MIELLITSTLIGTSFAWVLVHINKNKGVTLDCDICHKELHDDFFHFSGYLNGNKSNHIHVCSPCVVELNLHESMVNLSSKPA